MARGKTLQTSILAFMRRKGKPQTTNQITAGIRYDLSQTVTKALRRLEVAGDVVSYLWHFSKQGRPPRMWALKGQ